MAILDGDYSKLRKFVRSHLCQRCWHPLNVEMGPGRQYRVVCSNPNCGQDEYFVSQRFVEERRAADHGEYMEARRNLGKLLGIEQKPRSEKELISVLGG